jgi:hypothetical protein
VIGTWATMVLPMLACQMRTMQTPSRGTRSASTSRCMDREGPDRRRQVAAVADQSTKSLSIDTWPKR